MNERTYDPLEATPCSRHRCDAPCCQLYQVKLLEADVERLVGQGYDRSSFVEHENNYLYLRKGEVGCIFQIDSICKVHEHRPTSCRTYPWIESDNKIGTDEFCPYRDEFEFTWDMEKKLQESIIKLEEEYHARNICEIEQCDVCCCDTEMPLSIGDLRRITDLGYENFYRDRNGEFILKNVDHRCFFLGKEGLCAIYENRPEGCRFYPFILGKGGVVMDEDCPQREVFQPRFEQWMEDGLYELVGRLEEEREGRLVDKRNRLMEDEERRLADDEGVAPPSNTFKSNDHMNG
jgi:uncharacterized protein